MRTPEKDSKNSSHVYMIELHGASVKHLIPSLKPMTPTCAEGPDWTQKYVRQGPKTSKESTQSNSFTYCSVQVEILQQDLVPNSACRKFSERNYITLRVPIYGSAPTGSVNL